MSELPEGWIETTLDDACAKISDGTHHSPKEQYDEPAKGLYKYVTAKNIRMAGLDLKNLTYVPEKVHREIYSRCNPELGDVLLTKDGVNTGDVAINTLEEEFSLLSSVALLKPHPELLDPKYLRYYIESPQGTKRLTGEMRGAAIRRIILRSIKAASVPIAPLPEQRRIVARIEELFSRLDAGVAALRHAKAQLQRYRQSVLAAAVTGQLTQAWREQHPDTERPKRTAELFGTPLPESWECPPLNLVVNEGPRNGYSPICGNETSGSKVLKLSATSRDVCCSTRRQQSFQFLQLIRVPMRGFIPTMS